MLEGTLHALAACGLCEERARRGLPGKEVWIESNFKFRASEVISTVYRVGWKLSVGLIIIHPDSVLRV